MDKETAFKICVAFGLGGIMGILVMFTTEVYSLPDSTPYEQTYKYLFERVESHPNHIIRIDYYGKSYFTIPVLNQSWKEGDHIQITQQHLKSGESTSNQEGNILYCDDMGMDGIDWYDCWEADDRFRLTDEVRNG